MHIASHAKRLLIQGCTSQAAAEKCIDRKQSEQCVSQPCRPIAVACCWWRTQTPTPAAHAAVTQRTATASGHARCGHGRQGPAGVVVVFSHGAECLSTRRRRSCNERVPLGTAATTGRSGDGSCGCVCIFHRRGEAKWLLWLWRETLLLLYSHVTATMLVYALPAVM